MNELDVSTIGARLRTRREELGLTLAELAEKTRIRSAFLQDLEADQFDGFPGEAYLFGFLKTYAEVLGLESKGILDQFRRQAGKPAVAMELKPVARDLPVVRRRRRGKPLKPLLTVLVCGGLLAGLGYFAWHYWPFHDEKKSAMTEPLPAAPAVAVAPPAAEPALAATPAVAPEPPAGSATLSAQARSQPLPEEGKAAPAPPPPATLELGLPAAGGMLRVEALGEVNLAVWVDDLPPQKYALFKDSVISWRVTRSLRLQVDAPDLLSLRLGDDSINLHGRSELLLRGAGAEAKAEP